MSFLNLKPPQNNNSTKKPMPFDFQLGDSMAFLGMRGTGKTTLAIKLYQRLMDNHEEATGYVLDSNAAGDFTGWGGGYSGKECPIILPGHTGRQIVWQPPVDDYGAYEDLFRRIFDSCLRSLTPAVILIDELSCLGPGEHDYYARLLKRGRKRRGFPGITVFSISQEFAQKARVPRQTFSQMTHFAKFYVQHPYDIVEANKVLHLPSRVQPEHQHGFWHARLDRPPMRPVYYRGIEALDL